MRAGLASSLALVLGALPAAAHAEARKLSLEEAISIAVASRLELNVARAEVAAASAGIALAQARFAPHLLADLSLQQEQRAGAANRFAYRDLQLAGQLSLAGRAPWGMQYSLDWQNERRVLDDPFFAVYAPAWQTVLRLTLTQPLLRDLGPGPGLSAVRLATAQRDANEQGLKARAESIIGEVAAAYWQLVLAQNERAAHQVARQLAADQVDESKARLAHGAAGDLDLLEARAGLARGQSQLARAGQSVAAAETRLLLALQPSAADWPPSSRVEPSDEPQSVEQLGPVEAHVANGLARRSELAAAQAELEMREEELRLASDGLLPRLDLVGALGWFGFAGALQRNYATFGVDTPSGLNPPYFADPAVEGDLGTAYENLARRPGWSAQLSVRGDLPLQNGEARGRHERSRLAVEVAKARIAALKTRVATEIRGAHAEATALRELIAATAEAQAVTAKLLELTRVRFRGGVVSSFDVLRSSEALARARIEVSQAQISHRLALTRLALAEGRLLQQYPVLGLAPR